MDDKYFSVDDDDFSVFIDDAITTNDRRLAMYITSIFSSTIGLQVTF